jgi:hypothetical protein
MRYFFVAIMLICGGIAFAQESRAEVLRIGKDTFGFHADPCGSGQASLKVYLPSAAVRADFDRLAAHASLPEIELRESNAQNACALIHEGTRYIVLGNLLGGEDKEEGDADEVRGLDIVILAHELGHHACGHGGYTSDVQQNWKQELEADRYAGMLLAKMFHAGDIGGWNDNPEEFLSVVVDTLVHRGESSGYHTHPPEQQRRQAVRDGFYQGSSC